VNLTRALEESKRLADSIKPGSDRWDVIVVGSGAAGGMAALHSALASCAPGVVVVNIDNGFGAACAALKMLRVFAPKPE